MNEQLFKDLVFKAGFTGSDLHNTQFGTSYEHALKNLVELVVKECAAQCQEEYDSLWILTHFGVK